MHSTHPPSDFTAPSGTDISGTRELLALVLVFVAFSALGGGLYGMLGASGVPRGWLGGGPFESYLVPGAILFVVVGGSSLGASALIVSRARHAALGAAVASLVLVVWTAAQNQLIGPVPWLDSCLVGVALLELVLAVRLAFEPS